jgi:hypothetical protein
MPIHIDVSHLDRVVIAVVIGDIGADDITDLGVRFSAAGMRHYRKILDVTAGSLIIDKEGIATLATLVRSRPNAAERGPLAIVVNPANAHALEEYAKVTAEDRPVKTFHSLHAARRWLDEQSKIVLKR